MASPATSGRAGERPFPNPSGVLAVIGMNGADAENPFFKTLGTNGRSCVTCHQPAESWSVTPAELRDRMFEDACHETNYSMTNVLRGARAEEQNSAIIPAR